MDNRNDGIANGSTFGMVTLAVLAILARIAIAAAIGAGLLLMLIDEIVTTIIYVIAGMLGLWFTS